MKKKLIMSIIPILFFGLVIRFNMMATDSQNLKPITGLTDNKLQECPNKPNCVVSFYEKESEHFISPIETSLTLKEIKELLMDKMQLKLIDEKSNYLHFTQESSFFGFVDDIEILLIENKVYFRSASRVGYSDLGANKKRIEKIKEIINGKMA
jgi:uncharacterized protein (DUF1499 family)